METSARFDLALGVLAVCLSALAARLCLNVVSPPSVPVPVIMRAPDVPPVPDADSIDVLADVIVRRDPFRLANRPAMVVFSPTSQITTMAGVPVPPPPAIVRPTLVLKAIIGGPPWQAVVDGLPSRGPDAIVNVGDAIDRFHVVSVTAQAVVIKGPDTSWTLTMQGRP